MPDNPETKPEVDEFMTKDIVSISDDQTV